MTTNAPLPALPRSGKRINPNPAAAGLPDPRPLTDYTAAYSEVAADQVLLPCRRGN